VQQPLSVASITAALHALRESDAAGGPGPPWGEIDVRDTVDSTNLEARRRPDAWRVVVAAHQSAGRGRLARGWDSPAGLSTAVSVVVPVPADRPQDWGWLPLLTGMAVRESVREVTGVAAMLKWPNDVLATEPRSTVLEGAVGLEGASGVGWLKVAGILCELVEGPPPPSAQGGAAGGTAEGTRLAVVGAGTNVLQGRDQLTVPTATSLALCGAGPVDQSLLVATYLSRLAHWHGVWMVGGPGLEGLRAAYRSACLSIGAEVSVHLPAAADRRGLATGVDDAGRLLVRDAGGVTAYAAGDVVHLRAAPERPADPA